MPNKAQTNNSKLILASSSVYRQALLARVTTEFECISPDIDESYRDNEQAKDLAERLARGKALTIANEHPHATIIGSDQVASCKSRILGKPGNHETAAAQLMDCSGGSVVFHTAVHVCNLEQSFSKSHVDTTTVHFRNLSKAEIDAYLTAEKPWDCAGSFKSEGLGIMLFEAIENQDPTALIGLPMIWVSNCLRQAGIQIPAE
jgi:septum formation protein